MLKGRRRLVSVQFGIFFAFSSFRNGNRRSVVLVSQQMIAGTESDVSSLIRDWSSAAQVNRPTSCVQSNITSANNNVIYYHAQSYSGSCVQTSPPRALKYCLKRRSSTSHETVEDAAPSLARSHPADGSPGVRKERAVRLSSREGTVDRFRSKGIKKSPLTDTAIRIYRKGRRRRSDGWLAASGWPDRRCLCCRSCVLWVLR